MLNRYPLWKNLLIVFVLVPGFLYALPNLYGDQPAVQISPTRTASVDSAVLARMGQALNDAKIPWLGSTLEPNSARFRFADEELQLRAREILQRKFGDKYVVALNLQPATPKWLRNLGAQPMYLGLDLRGGVHFLMEVDTQGAVEAARIRYADDLRGVLRKEKIRYATRPRVVGEVIEIKFRDEEQRDRAVRLIDEEFDALQTTGVEIDGSPYLRSVIEDNEQVDIAKFALEQNMDSLRNRVNELGVAEPIIQQQGARRIVVQLPGVQDTARAKEILGQTATLETYLVDEEHNYEVEKRVPAGSRLYKMRRGGTILLKKTPCYSGNNIVDAAAGLDQQTGGAVVNITLDSIGAKRNQRCTGPNIGKRMAVVYVEQRSEIKKDRDGRALLDKNKDPIRVTTKFEEVITAPVIRDQLGARFQIEGMGGTKEAQDLALLLRAGALAAPVEIIEERTIGPSLGKENIAQGFESVVIGFGLVLVFMAIYYRAFGLVANVALTLNLVLIVAVLSLMQATLTMPGVAGIVLTVGMAVDANVLIFERIREELRAGNTPQASIHVGYDQALSTIIDANVTTLIAAIVLFNFGTGPIKGFAITLSIGILTSMFTAIVGTRSVINLLYGGRRLRGLPI